MSLSVRQICSKTLIEVQKNGISQTTQISYATQILETNLKTTLRKINQQTILKTNQGTHQ